MSPLSSDNPNYNPNPSLDDRVHVLVCVLPANMVNIDDSHLQKMAAVREEASRLGRRTPAGTCRASSEQLSQPSCLRW